MHRRSLINMAAAVLLAVPALASAQAYPSKPIKFIVPYAAGGLPDSVARVVAQRLTERLGQSVVVDNKPGGNGWLVVLSSAAGKNSGTASCHNKR